MVELVKTNVPGLDDILNGGIIKNAAVLVSGSPGTGKSIFGMQFLYNGVECFDENGVYMSFEEDARALQLTAESVGFDNWADHTESGRITVFDKQQLLRDSDFSVSLERLIEAFEDGEYERLVLDSLSMFEAFFDTEDKKRRYLLQFTDILKDYGVTSLLTNEQAAEFPESEFDIENYLTDGNIYLIQTPTSSGVNRYLWVAKMRAQNIDTDIFPMDIEDGGLTVHQNAAGFSMMQGGLGNPLDGDTSFDSDSF